MKIHHLALALVRYLSHNDNKFNGRQGEEYNASKPRQEGIIGYETVISSQ